MTEPAARSNMSAGDYRNLAALRREIRRFMAFSKTAVERAGLPPKQYEALLAIKARGEDRPMSVTALGVELFIRHNSAVELVSRLVAADLVVRCGSESDARLVHLQLTPTAEHILKSLAAVHRTQIGEQAPLLVAILAELGAASSKGPTQETVD